MKLHAFMKRLVICLTITLAAALIFSGTAFAEGEPPAAEPQAAPPAAEETVIVEPAAPPAVEPGAEAPAGAVSEELPAAAETLAIGEAAPVAEPAGRSGEPIAPAAQENTEPFAVGDPWWMVGLQKYAVVFNADPCPSGTSLGTSCWKNDYPIEAALAQIESMGVLPTDRKLYVEAGNYNDFVYIDGSGSILAQMTGLIGVDGPDVTTINNDVSIQSVLAGFAVSGFTVNGGVSITGSKGTILLQDLDVSNDDDDGIDVYYDAWWDAGESEWVYVSHVGAVTLNRVHSDDNAGLGADLNVTGTVKIYNSTFNHNSYFIDNETAGLLLDNYGASELNGVVADENRGDGIAVSSGSTRIMNVITNGNFNGGNGLGVWTYSGISTVENVVASSNGDNGVVLYSWMGSYIANNIEAQDNGNDGIFFAVDNGSGAFSNLFLHYNHARGLEAYVMKTITVNTIDVSFNGSTGVEISGCEVGYYDEFDNFHWTGVADPLVTIGNSVFPALQNQVFNNNGAGIVVNTAGTINIASVAVSGNTDEGIMLDKCYDDKNLASWICTGSGAVNIKSTIPGVRNWVNGNSTGITINSVKGNVLIENTNVQNADMNGITILALGTITLKGVSSSNNYLHGAMLDNSAATSPKTVVVQDLSPNPDSWFDDNGDNGLWIKSKGSITLKGVNANNNVYDGAEIDNCLAAVINSNEPCIGSGSIVVGALPGKMVYFEGKDRSGISIRTKGNVSINNISASGNNDDGIAVRNYFSNSIGNVLVNSSGGVINRFNENGLTFDGGGNNGLTIVSRGNITAMNSIANGNLNWGGGIVLLNHYGPIPRMVTVTNMTTNDNDSNGLYVYSKGTITFKNITAIGNANEGAYLNNHIDGFFGNITVSFLPGGCNIFNDNNGAGLLIDTYGIATIANVTAQGNYLTNTWLDWYVHEDGKVSMRDYYNDSKGADTWHFTMQAGTMYSIRLDAGDDVWSNPFAFDPYLQIFDEDHNLLATSDNDGGVSNALIEFTPSVTGAYLLAASGVGGNESYYILSVNDPTHTYGVFEYESSGVWIQAQKSAAVSGKNRYSSNSSAGLTISTPGNITIAGNTQASGNGAQGLNLRNCWGTGNVTISATSVVNDNMWQGVYVETSGIVSISNLTVNGNGLHGLHINAEANLKPVTLIRIIAQNNGQNGNIVWGGYGMLIYAQGKITLTSAKAWFNFTDGAKLVSNNNPVQVTLSSFMVNGEDGLEVDHGSGLFTSSGNIYLANINQDLYEY